MIGRLLKGEFEIVETLGAGGMGQVYIALQRSAGNRRVALKVLKSDLYGSATWDNIVSRFEGEILSLSQLNHPNIVTLYTSGVDEATQALFMAMELLAGESLEARLARSRLGHSEFFPFAADIIAGLAAAHERGIVHRDLKPANLMVVSHGRAPSIKILDFGIAKILSTESTQLTLGPSPATLLYSSPEHFHDSSEIGPESDVFSLGIVYYRMVSGLLPFRGRTQHELMRQILTEAPAPLGHESPAVEALVSRMLSKEKRGRPTLPEIRAELARIADTLAPGERWNAVAPPPAADASMLTLPGGVTVTLGGPAARVDAAPAQEATARPALETAPSRTLPAPASTAPRTPGTSARPAPERAPAPEPAAARPPERTPPPTKPAPSAPREPVAAPRRPLAVPIAIGAVLLIAAAGYLVARAREGAHRDFAAISKTTAGNDSAGAARDSTGELHAAGPETRPPADSAAAGTPGGKTAGARDETAAASPGARRDGSTETSAGRDAAARPPDLEAARRAAETALDTANAERHALEKLDNENLIPRLYFQEMWSEGSAAQAAGLQQRERKEYERARKSFETAARDYKRVATASRRLFAEVLGKAGAKPGEKLAALDAILREYPGARENANVKKLLADLSAPPRGG